MGATTETDTETDLRGLGSDLRARLAVRSEGASVVMDGWDPADRPLAPARQKAERQLVRVIGPALHDAHERLIAHDERSVLLVLQGLDASGKSGTIKHVVSHMNPVGVRVTSFKEPEGEEEREPFLARIERALPDTGELGVFDRSHYEDAIVPAALEPGSQDVVAERIAAINRFERRLTDDGVVLVKCCLHLSYDEQRDRFLRRVERPDKRWKFSDADLETRERWSDFVAAYGEVIGRTSTEVAPWYLVPADRKWFRNWTIALILLDVLGGLHEELPAVELDAEAIRRRLRPPR